VLGEGCQERQPGVEAQLVQNGRPEGAQQAEDPDAETTHQDDHHDGDDPGSQFPGRGGRRERGAGRFGHHGLIGGHVIIDQLLPGDQGNTEQWQDDQDAQHSDAK
jgi:hypothetical protein